MVVFVPLWGNIERVGVFVQLVLETSDVDAGIGDVAAPACLSKPTGFNQGLDKSLEGFCIEMGIALEEILDRSR
jgi:hypothetical protein